MLYNYWYLDRGRRSLLGEQELPRTGKTDAFLIYKNILNTLPVISWTVVCAIIPTVRF